MIIDLSDEITDNHSVPQGIVLKSLNFLIKVNDCSKKLGGKNDVVQFADDTTIICKFEGNENVPQKNEKVFKQNDKYLKEYQLTLYVDKTEMLYFTNHTNSDLECTFKGKVIKPAHAFRYLGAQID